MLRTATTSSSVTTDDYDDERWISIAQEYERHSSTVCVIECVAFALCYFNKHRLQERRNKKNVNHFIHFFVRAVRLSQACNEFGEGVCITYFYTLNGVECTALYIHTHTHTLARVQYIRANQAFNVGSYKSENETQRFYLFFLRLSIPRLLACVQREKNDGGTKKMYAQALALFMYSCCRHSHHQQHRGSATILIWNAKFTSIPLALSRFLPRSLFARNPPSSMSFDRRFLLVFFTLSKRLSRYAWYVRFARTYMYVAHDPCRLYFFPSKQ